MCYPFDIEECKVYEDHRDKISVGENKLKYVANNRNENLVCLIRVDGCLIKKGIRCDYLLLNCDSGTAYFIELKGSDLIQAVKQIDNSIDLLEIPKYKVNARIVLNKTKAPDLRSSKYKRLEIKLKKYNGDLKQVSKKFEEEI